MTQAPDIPFTGDFGCHIFPISYDPGIMGLTCDFVDRGGRARLTIASSPQNTGDYTGLALSAVTKTIHPGSDTNQSFNAWSRAIGFAKTQILGDYDNCRKLFPDSPLIKLFDMYVDRLGFNFSQETTNQNSFFTHGMGIIIPFLHTAELTISLRKNIEYGLLYGNRGFLAWLYNVAYMTATINSKMVGIGLVKGIDTIARCPTWLMMSDLDPSGLINPYTIDSFEIFNKADQFLSHHMLPRKNLNHLQIYALIAAMVKLNCQEIEVPQERNGPTFTEAVRLKKDLAEFFAIQCVSHPETIVPSILKYASQMHPQELERAVNYRVMENEPEEEPAEEPNGMMQLERILPTPEEIENSYNQYANKRGSTGIGIYNEMIEYIYDGIVIGNTLRGRTSIRDINLEKSTRLTKVIAMSIHNHTHQPMALPKVFTSTESIIIHKRIPGFNKYPIPEKLKPYQVKTRSVLYKLGKKFSWCVSSRALNPTMNDTSTYFHYKTVLLEISWSNEGKVAIVKQCLDARNQTTELSKQIKRIANAIIKKNGLLPVISSQDTSIAQDLLAVHNVDRGNELVVNGRMAALPPQTNYILTYNTNLYAVDTGTITNTVAGITTLSGTTNSYTETKLYRQMGISEVKIEKKLEIKASSVRCGNVDYPILENSPEDDYLLPERVMLCGPGTGELIGTLVASRVRKPSVYFRENLRPALIAAPIVP